MHVDAFARGYNCFSLYIVHNNNRSFFLSNKPAGRAYNNTIREVLKTLSDTLLIVIVLSRSGIFEKLLNFFPLCLCPSHYPTQRGVSMGILDIHVGPLSN
jgi:hypothetical protein